MKRSIMLVCAIVLSLSVSGPGARTDEGMWLLDSLNKLPLDFMRKTGLELTPKQIYDPAGPSLKDAIILLGGGTASFVSADGLILTNHHVAYNGIQALSSVQDDYLQNGFWAKSRAEELSTSYTAQILKEMRDVTGEIFSAVSDTMNPEQRTAAIRAKSREVEKAAKGSTDLSCRVSETFGGLKYYLYTFETLNDIRLVYAPPTAIGNYGSEVDNWIWPRHTGDFSFMRAYVGPDGKPAKYAKENVPYHPKVFLRFSTAGFHEGSFAMILGFPGTTFRYREAAGVELAHDQTLPTTIDLYKTRIDIINAAGSNDRALEIKYASKVRGIANTYKKFVGILEGMHRSDVIAIKRNDERAFAAWINGDPARTRKYGTLLGDLEKANADMRAIGTKSIFLQNFTSGIDLYRLAARFRSYAASFSTDSTGTPLAPPERDRASLREFISSTFKNLDLGVDKKLMTALILKGADLQQDQQPAPFRDVIGSRTGPERDRTVMEYVDDLYESTRLSTPDGCAALMEKDPDAIGNDACVALATAIEKEQAPITEAAGTISTQLTALRKKYIEAWLAWKNGSLVYPDANRTIRMTYGQVEPFRARDAVEYDYVTTLSGVMEKETGADPFIVPPRLKELWQKKDFGRYADAGLHDVPVAFVADLDITGGNSGSPVMNGKGELIGCAFDGNWESVVGDYYFQHELNRTIAVDARYILFVLDKFSGAENILKELVVH